VQSPAPPNDTNSIQRIRDALKGEVIGPEDAGYDEARAVFYGIDHRPAVIVRVADVDEVVEVISLARETGLQLAIRSGGHSLVGHSVAEGGIVLDLSHMRDLQIDAEHRTAWAETGLTAGEYTAAAGVHGLATGFGDAGSVGIGGITLGGGVGFLVRKHGLTIDDLLAAEIVTADGRLLHVDDETHPDLFWAIRGGGGNFGVVTRFKFRLHEVDKVFGGIMILPATPETVRSFVETAEVAPEELSTIANIMTAPPMPFLPEEYHGQVVLFALLVYAGEAEAGESAVAPFRALATPIVDMLQPMRYQELYEEEGPHPTAVTVRSMFVDRVDQETAEAIVDRLQTSTANMAATQLRVLGGAMARVPGDATAFAHRGRKLMVNVAAMYEKPEDAPSHEAWADDLAGAITNGESGVYVNFLGDEGEARVREAYPGSTWDRLREVKRRYDPTNLFRLNQNIPPAG
jgi:FAD/FMN-containing dehydrogenase